MGVCGQCSSSVVASAQRRLIHSERDRPAAAAALSMRARRLVVSTALKRVTSLMTAGRAKVACASAHAWGVSRASAKSTQPIRRDGNCSLA